MSVKNNSFVAAAALALGVTVAAGFPVAEGMLNDVPVAGLKAAEITDGTGRVLVFAGVVVNAETFWRPVADANGSVRLFKDGSAVVALSKRVALAAGASVELVKFVAVASVGDPVVALKSRYKRAVNELDSATAKRAVVLTKKTAAESQGWDTAVGTPEATEYADIVARVQTLGEWVGVVDALKTTLAAALTAAGVDPATVA